MPKDRQEWIDKTDFAYHQRQLREPYRSTIAFCDWIESIELIDKESRFHILDLACGQGANIAYLSKRYPHCQFTGVDINSSLVETGNRFFETHGLSKCRLALGDLYQLDESWIGRFDAVVSFQTLSWLPEFEPPLHSLCRLNAKWIALTSLFYDGPLSCKIEVQDYGPELEPTESSYYNVYSLPLVEQCLASARYTDFQHIPFEIDIDLDPPESKGKGTYTERLNDGRRLQFSGPLHLPWQFIAASMETHD